MNEEQDMLSDLKKGVPQAFEALYRKYYRMIEDLVMKMGGKSEDARDVFQEALFVLVKNVRKPDFQLTSKLSTLLYAISRNIWLKTSKKGSGEISMESDKLAFLGQVEAEEVISPEEKESLFSIMLEKLGQLEEDCRSIINYTFYQKLAHTEVAAITGYSVSFIKVKKFRCLEHLRKLVKTTAPFHQL